MGDHQVILAWAVEVDPIELGARLDTYAKCKAAISTFRLCCDERKFSWYQIRLDFISRGLVPTRASEVCMSHNVLGYRSLPGLPPEVIRYILKALEDTVYDECFPTWFTRHYCVMSQCESVHYYDPKTLASKREEWCELLDTDFEDESEARSFEDWLGNDHFQSLHHDTLDQQLRLYEGSDTRFNECIKVSKRALHDD